MGFFKSIWSSGKKRSAEKKETTQEPDVSVDKITDIAKLSEIAIATADKRRLEGKRFFDFEGFDRTMRDIGRAACQSDVDKARIGALIESAVHGWDFMFIARKTGSEYLARETKECSEVLRELESELPADPKGQREYIDSIDTRVEYTGLHSTKWKLIGCCLLIDALRPYAYDIAQAVETMSLYCDLRAYGASPGSKSEGLAAHERKCEAWKESAERLIEVAQREPETLYPVWGKLKKAIDGAETQVKEKKQVGVKTTNRRVSPDAPQDWTEKVTVPVYEDVTEKKPMGLHFPAE
ncbi:MAG: hypothetical protein Q4C36_00560 [Coriobacteriia bacterium]|nr:hypothetical protein [Coriobacteriia bacterium]